MLKFFSTERLTLKPTSEEDAAFLLQLVNSPSWIKYIGDRNVYTIHDAKEYIRNRIQPQLDRLGYGNYIMIRKSDNEKLGSCGLYDREGLEGIDLGFAILPEYENQGYAFEASERLKRAAFEEFKIPQLNAITTKDNLLSQKLIKKLGLKFKSMIRLPNDDEDIMLFVLKNTGSRIF